MEGWEEMKLLKRMTQARQNNQPTRKVGSDAEARAARFLQKKGLVILNRNYSVRTGEIDLIARDGSTLVFVEVRHRASQRHGSGAESVTHFKQQRIIKAARYYLQQHYATSNDLPPCRFDVVSSSTPNAGDRATLEWIKNAFC